MSWRAPPADRLGYRQHRGALARFVGPSDPPRRTAQKWVISVIESGETPVSPAVVPELRSWPLLRDNAAKEPHPWPIVAARPTRPAATMAHGCCCRRIDGPWVSFRGSEFRSTPRRGPDGTGPAALPASASTGIPGIPGIQGSPPPRPLTPGAPCGRNNDPEVPPVLGQDRPGPASLHQKRTRGPWVRFFGSEFRSTPQRGPSGAGSRAGPGLCIPAFRASVQSAARPREAGALYVGKNNSKVPPPPVPAGQNARNVRSAATMAQGCLSSGVTVIGGPAAQAGRPAHRPVCG